MNINNYLILFIFLFGLSFIFAFFETNKLKQTVFVSISLNCLAMLFVSVSDFVDGNNLDGMVFALFINLIAFCSFIVECVLQVWFLKHKTGEKNGI